MVGNDRKFDQNIVPSYLMDYMLWYPTILLVPGPLWEKAIQQLGVNNQIEIKENVEIMNTSWGNGDLKFSLRRKK